MAEFGRREEVVEARRGGLGEATGFRRCVSTAFRLPPAAIAV